MENGTNLRKTKSVSIKEPINVGIRSVFRNESVDVQSPTTLLARKRSSQLLTPTWSFMDDDFADILKKAESETSAHHVTLKCSETDADDDVIELIPGDVIFKFQS